MAFRIGQKVVCVNASGNPYVRHGEIYTIVAFSYAFSSGKLGLFFQEPDNGHKTAFYDSRFRPLIERKTDITVFENMLRPKEVKEPV